VLGTTKAFYIEDVFPLGKDSNPVLGFAFAVGRAANVAYGLPIAAGALAGMLLLEGFVITTLDTAVRLNRYLIEEIWQEFFGRFDVFASRARAAGGRESAGSCGIPDRLESPQEPRRSEPVPTRGLLRGFLRFISFYWVNSGLAVALMLVMAFSGGILQLWKLFATSNQLLAAFVLGIGSIWLLRNGRRTWYVLTPALFMLVTTAASLLTLLSRFRPGMGADGKPVGNPTLFAADVVVIALTVYLVLAGIRELLAAARRRQPSASSTQLQGTAV